MAGGEVWAAVSTAPVKVGENVTIENAMTLTDFNSKSLNRTFKTIVFGSLAGAGGKGADLATPHGSKVVDDGKIKVTRAVGPDAHTVEEIVTRAASLKDKTVLLRAKVVKYNPEIMGKNWLHLRDGTGSEAKGSNDILVTTSSQAHPGDVVTVKGRVRTGKDFGAGYSYKVMIEDAKLLP
ncbi:MAG: nucleotide-binding protein [Gallionella sp.]|nr:nucleotide-binding protein [Gallionella sp.]